MRVTTCSCAVIVLVMAQPTALAHTPEIVTPDRLWRTWTLDAVVLMSLAAIASTYAVGVRRLWRSAGTGRGISAMETVAFTAGLIAVATALVSPLDALGGTLLSAHMAQHGLLAGIAAPLLVSGGPILAAAWAWRSPFLQRLIRSAPAKRAARCLGALATPLAATAVHGVLLWIWHAPALFGAAVVTDWLHALQHLSFLGSALLFWWALLHASPGRGAATAAAGAFLTFMHTGLLGALFTFAQAPLYPFYAGRSTSWGVTALEDQQLAGLLMWVPLGVPYLAGGLFLAARLVTREMVREERAS